MIGVPRLTATYNTTISIVIYDPDNIPILYYPYKTIIYKVMSEVYYLHEVCQPAI